VNPQGLSRRLDSRNRNWLGANDVTGRDPEPYIEAIIAKWRARGEPYGHEFI